MTATMEVVKAGRELDCMIAERVMGFTRCTNLPHDGHFPNTYCYAAPDTSTKGAEVRAYSTDIAAAWEVVEKLTSLGMLQCIERSWFDHHDAPSGNWICRIENGQGFHLCRAGAETASLAICLAALQAVEPGT